MTDSGTTERTGNRRRATIEDVASAAGVSVATVSRAMRGLPNVALSTRERVLRIAGDLSYRPDPAAARLATGRSRSVALAVPLLNSWYFSQVVAGAEAVCAEEGYDVVVIGVSSPAARHALFDDTTSIHRRVDGLVVVDIPLSPHDEAALQDRKLAAVSIGGATERFPSVGIDDVAVADLATTHLVDLGHLRIGLITGQHDDPLGFQVPIQRRQGFTAALARAGLAVDPSREAPGNFSVMGGRDAMATMLRMPDPPTGVFAMSDEMAFGALMAAREHGVRVPEDLSIVGVDDHDVSVVLGLTTVRQNVADLGARAARLLIDQLVGGGRDGGAVPPARHQSPVELVVRDTTAPPGPHRVETAPKP